MLSPHSGRLGLKGGIVWLALTAWLAAHSLLSAAQAGSGSSNAWYAHVWRTDDGLPDNAITGLTQTPDGFIWVSTQGGLVRFDGSRFHIFSAAHITNVPNRVVRSLAVDRSGNFWLAMDRGVVVSVAQDNAEVFTHDDGLLDTYCRPLVEDGEGAIWLAYPIKETAARIKDGKVRLFGIKEGLPATVGGWFATDIDGTLWFCKGGSVGVFRDGRFKTIANVNDEYASIATARSGGIWVCTREQLFKLHEDGNLQDRGRLPQRTEEAGFMMEDGRGAVWIATLDRGLLRYDGSRFETIYTSHPLVNCMMEDREGNLWVGTGGGGLDRLRPRTLELLNEEMGRRPDSVRSICEDSEGRLWVVSRDGILTGSDGKQWSTVTSRPSWPGGIPSCVAADHDGGIWIGTRGEGLYKYLNNEFRIYRATDGLAADSIRSLLVSSAGDLWIGTDAPRRLQRLSNGKFETYDLPAEARSIRAMAEDASQNVWIGTADGSIFRATGDRVVDVTTNDVGRTISIRCLHATPDGSVWIGYAGFGVGRLKDGRFSRIKMSKGLHDDYIFQIVADRQGWLWIAGSRGLFRVQQKQMIDVMEGREPMVRSIVFGRGEGLPGLQATLDFYPSTLLGRDGRPRIATRTGVLVVHPDNIRDNPHPPPVLVERMTVDGQAIAQYGSKSPLCEENKGAADLRVPGVGLRIPPRHLKVQFDFTALSFTAPENVRFRYMLEGLEKDWTEVSTETRSVGYTRLPAGDYRLRVTACNHTGVWNDAPATLAFTVMPFVWQTWWFRGGVLVGFTLSLIAIVRYVSFRRLRSRLIMLEQQAALEKERTRIARDLHDDLGGSLTQAALLLDMSRADAAARPDKVEQCSAIVRQVVKSVDEIIWAINPRNDTVRYLIDYMSQFAVEFLHAAGIPCRVELPDRLPERAVSPEARHNLFLVMKEALNNIARHARAKQVKLRFAVTNDSILMTIEDDGRGFATSPDNSTSDGLRNMRQRMKEIAGEFQLDSRPGLGTKVAFRYPWPNGSDGEGNGA